MRTSTVILLGLFILAGTAGAQLIPPINLQADLQPGGGVTLTWDEPPDGLFEDFEDGVADSFDLYPEASTWDINEGYLKSNASAATWQCAVYEGLEFTDFTVETTWIAHDGTTSRGIQFRADGPRDDDYNGYNFYIALTSDSYSIWKFVNGSSSTPISWTPSDLINGDVGDTNTMKVVGQGSTFDLYINGTLVDSFTDPDHPTGKVGLIASSSAQVWYDYISCNFGATMNARSTFLNPIRSQVAMDEDGNVLDENAVRESSPAVQMSSQTAQPNRSIDELDEFLYYVIYRDGTEIGTSNVETFDDQLPSLGEHTYQVTAFYDEGESGGPSITVNWEPVLFELIPQTTTLPPGGGTLLYGVSLQSMIGVTVPGLRYWTMVDLPNGQSFGPLFQQNFTLMPFMDVDIANLQQNVPGMAPGGVYTFYGHIGFYPNPGATDSFQFEKTGTATGTFNFDPDQWPAYGRITALDEQQQTVLPSEFTMSAAYPNPFNPETTVSITLPEAANLKVVVYNTAGQKVATLTDGLHASGTHTLNFDGSNLASGLYLVQVEAEGFGTVTQKAMLMK